MSNGITPPSLTRRLDKSEVSETCGFGGVDGWSTEILVSSRWIPVALLPTRALAASTLPRKAAASARELPSLSSGYTRAWPLGAKAVRIICRTGDPSERL